jgi:hypothetical protein
VISVCCRGPGIDWIAGVDGVAALGIGHSYDILTIDLCLAFALTTAAQNLLLMPPTWTGSFTLSTNRAVDGELIRSEVVLQRSYTGPSWFLPDEFAGMKCSDLGPDRLLYMLNSTLQTEHTRDPHTNAVLDRCIESGFDLGLASAFVRSFWNGTNLHQGLKKLEKRRRADAKMRDYAIQGEFVLKDIPPRRVWDLLSNRVIPYYWTKPPSKFHHWDINRPAYNSSAHSRYIRVYPVSHSWVTEGERSSIWTPINNFEWSVPVPNATTLHHIRIELLNSLEMAHVEEYCYAWLDVLCLRQQCAPEKEGLRMQEWRLDVPTIGRVYACASHILYYFNGLGIPFRNTGLESDRHWLNRAWTVQEMVTAGHTENIFCGMTVQAASDDYWEGPILEDLFLGNLLKTYNDICLELRRIMARKATNELDKVASLCHLVVRSGTLVPVYTVGEDSEVAWARLVSCMDDRHRAVLKQLFLFQPSSRSGEHHSWEELKRTTIPRDVTYLDNLSKKSVQGYIFQGWKIAGLSSATENTQPREGAVMLTDGTALLATAYHGGIVTEDEVFSAIQISTKNGWERLMEPLIADFIIGRISEDGVFEALTIVEVEADDETKLNRWVDKTTGRSVDYLMVDKDTRFDKYPIKWVC